MGFGINNNNPKIVNNKLTVGKAKEGDSIDLSNLKGLKVSQYKNLISYVEKTQNVKIDTDGNGIIEGNEASIFQNALTNLAGKNGRIDKNDFKHLKGLDKEDREDLLYKSRLLANDSTNSKVTTFENGDYERYDKRNILSSGKKNGVSYTAKQNFTGTNITQSFEDGSELILDKAGKELSGKTASNEAFRTTYIDGVKARNFIESGLTIFYEGDKEICRMDSDKERYSYQKNDDGSYQKTYLNKKETRVYNAKDELVSGIDDGGNYKVIYGENKTYTKEYDSGKSRIYNEFNKHIGGKDGGGREYDITYDNMRYGTKQITYKDNNEVFITSDDNNNKIFEHRTSSYTAKYEYNSDDSYVVTSYNPNDKYRIKPRLIQTFDNQKRLIQYKDCTSKGNDYSCTYDDKGNSTIRYSNGYTCIYDKDEKLISENGLKIDNQELANNVKLDGKFSQGDVGDCWLVSGLSAIMLKPGGTEFLEKQINYNEQKGVYTVTLPGARRKYSITQDEINDAKYLSNGDKDVRLFEIAMDKYLKETTNHSLDEHGTSLDGNTSEAFYDALFGKYRGKTVMDENIDLKIFNNKKVAYTAANTGSYKANGISPDGKKYPLSNGHGYSVAKSDEKYVYLVDPGVTFDPQNPEANLIKVENEYFKLWCNAIMSGTLT